MSKKVVLVVDDEYINLEILEAMLEGEFDVRVAFNGASALEVMDEVPVDAMLLDIQMPEMDGYEVAASMKEKGLIGKIPFFFVTASDEDDVITACETYSAQGFVLKPVGREDLIAKLKAIWA